MIWAVPVVMAALVALPVGFAVKRVAREGAALRREVVALVALRPLALDLADDARAVVGRGAALRVRARPPAPPAS